MDELELFTVSYKGNGNVGVEFNAGLLLVATKEEIFEEMAGDMDSLTPIVSKIMKFLSEKSDK